MPSSLVDKWRRQLVDNAPVSMWLAPCGRVGVGWSMLALSALACLTVNMLLGWVLIYAAVSVRSLGALLLAPADAELPWRSCNHTWNTRRCADRFAAPTSNLSFNLSANLSVRRASRASRTLCSTRTSPSPLHLHLHFHPHSTLLHSTPLRSVPISSVRAHTQDAGENGSLVWPAHAFAPRSAGEEFWLFGVLNISSGAFPLLHSCLCLCIVRRTEDCGMGTEDAGVQASSTWPASRARCCWRCSPRGSSRSCACRAASSRSAGCASPTSWFTSSPSWTGAPGCSLSLSSRSFRLPLRPVTRQRRSTCARVRAGGLRDGHRALPAARHSPRARRVPRRRARRHSVLRAPALRAPPHPTGLLSLSHSLTLSLSHYHSRPLLQPAGQRPLTSFTLNSECFCFWVALFNSLGCLCSRQLTLLL